jgi:hypothetical protein
MPGMEGIQPPQINWDRIEKFIGFGRFDAPVVFIGMEEGLSGEETLEANLLRRSSFQEIMDSHNAFVREKDGRLIELIPGTIDFFNLNRRGGPKCQRTWRVVCDLMLRRAGTAAPTKIQRSLYQATSLGRGDSDTLLCELLPYPHVDAVAWHDIYVQRFKTRAAYEAAMIPQRRDLLNSIILSCTRELVVCYGVRHWSEFQQLFPDAKWQNRSIFRVADLMSTRLVLAPHFVTKDFNTNEDLTAFAPHGY